ncbi:MAG: hypothetical protein JJ908_14360 [Rhizobiales bacterium]|nr:hypothetical protein [Hyphomicrobiales bacterium]MBO6700286.1 hypothetical protein [Hyphomicrobiales bacterium]MBO6737549.1 hypothetical protein [Hyphomicrobiales bacterium]MBO6913394.1 hypothetical protein [Hyphomicrobiales bacterium]MBO6955810.1 hypothetical protein [Hyphomicrobiales bacterium]
MTGLQTIVARCLALRSLMVALLVGALVAPVPVAMANERIISDPSDRVALFGFDPVAYLADGEAREGLPEFELVRDRLVWRFANAGNLEAFVQDPERFVPAYGGHGALMVSRGAVAIGHPAVWLALGGRVFLFRDQASRYAFLLEAAALIDQADAAWPVVRDTLAP